MVIAVAARCCQTQPVRGKCASQAPGNQDLKPCTFEVLVARIPSASLIPRGIGIAAVVRRRRRWRSVHRHGSRSARHHGQRTTTALLHHRHLRVLRHDLQHALVAFLFLFALPCLNPLTTFTLALLDLLDLTSVMVLASFFFLL